MSKIPYENLQFWEVGNDVGYVSIGGISSLKKLDLKDPVTFLGPRSPGMMVHFPILNEEGFRTPESSKITG